MFFLPVLCACSRFESATRTRTHSLFRFPKLFVVVVVVFFHCAIRTVALAAVRSHTPAPPQFNGFGLLSLRSHTMLSSLRALDLCSARYCRSVSFRFILHLAVRVRMSKASSEITSFIDSHRHLAAHTQRIALMLNVLLLSLFLDRIHPFSRREKREIFILI